MDFLSSLQGEYILDFYPTLVVIVGVLLLGRFVIKYSTFLQTYNIPEPVVGGIIIAIFFLLLSVYGGISFKFEESIKNPLMLAFFASIGLSADFASLKQGGKLLGVFLIVVVIALLGQNVIGLSLASVMGIDSVIGLLAGSITMSGGHGTGAAWAGTFIQPPYGFAPATEVAIAAATFGLIAGGLIGGPVAHFLIKRYNLKPSHASSEETPTMFEAPKQERLITPISFVESLALIAIALYFGNLLDKYVNPMTEAYGFKLPTFVYCLFVGVILRNVLEALNIHKVFDREVSVLGNVSLSLFLAFALMTINLAQLIGLAAPLIVILTAQVLFIAAFTAFVTFTLCGKNYDAAVLAAGHCGFGLGATPTAMVNMQAVTSHYGQSHTAFIIVPLVGAFFIDIINAIVIQFCLSFITPEKAEAIAQVTFLFRNLFAYLG